MRTLDPKMAGCGGVYRWGGSRTCPKAGRWLGQALKAAMAT